MPKCSSCPQFQPKDTDVEPEIDVSVDEDGLVTGSARIVNQCEGCGEELEEYTFEVEVDLSSEIAEHEDPNGKHCKEHRLDVEAEGSRLDETQTKDRHGKPIKRARYMRRYYGVDVTVTVSCRCGTEFTGSFTDKVQASGMDSLV